MLSSRILVRQYNVADAEMVEEIERTWIKEITSLSQLARYYEIIPECFLVAEAEGKVVGYLVANMHFARDRVWEGHILALAVHPSYRRNGVGRQMLSQISGILKGRGASRIRLEVKLDNSDARKFYLQEGFKELGVVHGYYRMRGYSEDAVIVVRDLQAQSARVAR